jgi:hypothetical protein
MNIEVNSLRSGNISDFLHADRQRRAEEREKTLSFLDAAGVLQLATHLCALVPRANSRHLLVVSRFFSTQSSFSLINTSLSASSFFRQSSFSLPRACICRELLGPALGKEGLCRVPNI